MPHRSSSMERDNGAAVAQRWLSALRCSPAGLPPGRMPPSRIRSEGPEALDTALVADAASPDWPCIFQLAMCFRTRQCTRRLRRRVVLPRRPVRPGRDGPAAENVRRLTPLNGPRDGRVAARRPHRVRPPGLRRGCRQTPGIHQRRQAPRAAAGGERRTPGCLGVRCVRGRQGRPAAARCRPDRGSRAPHRRTRRVRRVPVPRWTTSTPCLTAVSGAIRNAGPRRRYPQSCRRACPPLTQPQGRRG